MDSVTQAVLGASVGHAIAGEKAGKAAMIVGAVGGSIPDLDILFSPVLDSVSQLGFHRGISHSFAFAIVAAPLFGAAARRLVRGPVPTSTWALVGLAALITHILLDTLTVYGTGLYEPFSNARLAYPMLFIIDPLYTIPLIGGLIGAIVVGVASRRAVRWSRVGLMLSCLYLAWAGTAKGMADNAFEDRFAAMGLQDAEFISMPTPLNTVLWRALAKVDGGTLETYYSLIADTAASTPQLVVRQDSLLAPVRGSRASETAIWFSQGFYKVSVDDGMPELYDLRFGRSHLDDGDFMLTLAFGIDPSTGEPGLAERWGWSGGPGPLLREVWSRTIGGNR